MALLKLRDRLEPVLVGFNQHAVLNCARCEFMGASSEDMIEFPDGSSEFSPPKFICHKCVSKFKQMLKRFLST